MFPALCQYWRIGQVIVMWSSFGFSYHLQISDLKGPSTPPRVFSQCPLAKSQSWRDFVVKTEARLTPGSIQFYKAES